jgi:phosphoglycolate phosphatase-like HAD superfamily hydrolase
VPGPLLSDLDGTIADTEPVIFEALHLTCAAFGIELARDADLRFALGPPLHWVLEQLGFGDDVMADAIAVFQTAHIERIDLCTPMPGADVVLRELASSGVTVGIATIKPQDIAQLVLETIGVADAVHALHGRADDMDPRTKTDLLRDAWHELGGDDPLYVGDHDNDERAARELGIPFLWYPANDWATIRSAVLAGSASRA